MSVACLPLLARARERSDKIILFPPHPPLLRRPRQQGETRGKQQHEDENPKRNLVQLAVKLQPKPRANQHGRQSDPEQSQRFGDDDAGAAEPKERHHEYRNHDGLENRALVILGPTTQTGRHDDREAPPLWHNTTMGCPAYRLHQTSTPVDA